MQKVFSLIVLTVLVTGCASTTIDRQWRDPGYRGPGARSAIVVGLPAESPAGLGCTDEFVKQLRERQIQAVPGYGTAAVLSKERGIEKARELGVDVLLVCRFLERRTQLDIYPRDTETLLLGPNVELWSPVEYVENPYDVFGTAVYDAATGKAIWSAESDTYAGTSQKKIIPSYVKAMVRKLEEEGLLRR